MYMIFDLALLYSTNNFEDAYVFVSSGMKSLIFISKNFALGSRYLISVFVNFLTFPDIKMS